MKASELLRIAIDRHLWDGRGRKPNRRASCLCFAGGRALQARGTPETDAACRRIHTRIAAALRPHRNMAAWLESQGVKLPRGYATIQAVQAHRKAWAEKLIAEFEAEGD